MRILFLDASTDVLVRRYESHAGAGTRSTTATEAWPRPSRPSGDLLEPVKAEPTWSSTRATSTCTSCAIACSRCSVTTPPMPGMQTTIMSFGYKHGLPLDADLVIDCRFLPNPHWVEELRPLTRPRRRGARRTCSSQPVTGEFLGRPRRAARRCCCRRTCAEGKSYLTVAFGCTGGHHRSVVIAEELARRLRERRLRARVVHRDIER